MWACKSILPGFRSKEKWVKLWLQRTLVHMRLHTYFIDRRANDNTEGKSLIYQLALWTSSPTGHLIGRSEDHVTERWFVLPGIFSKVPSFFQTLSKDDFSDWFVKGGGLEIFKPFHLKTPPNSDVTMVWHPQRLEYTSTEPRQGEKYKLWGSALIKMSWEPVASAGQLCNHIILFTVLTCLEQFSFVAE